MSLESDVMAGVAHQRALIKSYFSSFMELEKYDLRALSNRH